MFLKREESPRILVLLGLFVVILCSQFAYSYFETVAEYKSNFDLTLSRAAEQVDVLIDGPNFHSGLRENSLSLEEETQMAITLTKLVSISDLSYIYTLVKVNDEFRFVSSSLTPEEIAGSDYESVFWTVYDDAPSELLALSDASPKVFANYSDQWGDFRSVFVLKPSKDKSRYIVGVDLPITELKAIYRISAIEALQRSFLFFSLCVPFLFYAIRVTQASFRRRRETLLRDELTGLQNKRALLDDIPAYKNPTLLILNIDRFREVSHGYSYQIGDVVLSSFAYNLHNYEDKRLANKKVYRLYSDEFAVLVESPLDYDENVLIFQDFYDFVVTRKYRVSENEVISFRITVGITHGKSSTLFEQAEIALRLARETGRSVVPFHQANGLPERYLSSLAKHEAVKCALDENRLVPYFHPIVCTKTNVIEKYEVLARLVDDNGVVTMMPDEFIPILKMLRLYNRFSLNLLEKALAVAKSANIDISFNISTKDISSARSFKRLLSIVKESGIAQKTHFELLECDSLVSQSVLIRSILKLKRLGCRVGLDDLGKEYSNFDRLMALPVDFVKLDRGVMPNLNSSAEVASVAEKVIAFAKAKDITIVAEFCSSAELCLQARALGIDFVQGFYLAEPSSEIVEEVGRF